MPKMRRSLQHEAEKWAARSRPLRMLAVRRLVILWNYPRNKLVIKRELFAASPRKQLPLALLPLQQNQV